MELLNHGLVLLFFLVLFGQSAYREAKRANRSSPGLRGAFWAVFGIVGAISYLVHARERERTPLAWMGVSVFLVAVWIFGTFGPRGLDGGYYFWGGLFSGLLILYWKFSLEEVERSGENA